MITRLASEDPGNFLDKLNFCYNMASEAETEKEMKKGTSIFRDVSQTYFSWL